MAQLMITADMPDVLEKFAIGSTNGTGIDLSVVDDGGEPAIKLSDPGQGGDTTLVVPSVADAENVELLIRARALTSTTAPKSGLAGHIKPAGTCYAELTTNSAQTIRSYVGFAPSNLGVFSTGFSDVTYTWRKLKLTKSGTSTRVQAKAWKGAVGDEPAGWLLDNTNAAADIQGPGAVGIYIDAPTEYHVTHWAVGTNGDPVPIEPLAEATAVPVTQSQVLNSPQIEQTHVLEVQPVTQGQVLSEPAAVPPAHAVPDPITQSQALSSVELEQTHELAVAPIVQGQVLDAPTAESLGFGFLEVDRVRVVPSLAAAVQFGPD